MLMFHAWDVCGVLALLLGFYMRTCHTPEADSAFVISCNAIECPAVKCKEHFVDVAQFLVIVCWLGCFIFSYVTNLFNHVHIIFSSFSYK